MLTYIWVWVRNQFRWHNHRELLDLECSESGNYSTLRRSASPCQPIKDIFYSSYNLLSKTLVEDAACLLIGGEKLLRTKYSKLLLSSVNIHFDEWEGKKKKAHKLSSDSLYTITCVWASRSCFIAHRYKCYNIIKHASYFTTRDVFPTSICIWNYIGCRGFCG